MNLTNSNLDLFKNKNNINFFDAKSLNFVKYLKEIKLIKHWRNHARNQNFMRKRKTLSSNFIFSKQSCLKNIFKSFTTYFNKAFDLYNMHEMNKRSIVFGDKQIQSFVPYFSMYWNTYNDELKVFLKQILDFLVNINTVILKEYESQKNHLNIAQNNKNKYKGNELKTIELMLKYKSQSMNFLTAFFEKLLKLYIITMKSANINYFNKFLKSFMNFFNSPDKYKHEIYYSISAEKKLVPKPSIEIYIKRLDDFMKTMMNDYVNLNPLLSMKEKFNFLLSNPILKKGLPSIMKYLDTKTNLKEKLLAKSNSIMRALNDVFHSNYKKVQNIISLNDNEINKLFEIKGIVENLDVDKIDIDKFVDNYMLIENFNPKLNEKYDSSFLVLDFSDVKKEFNKLKEKMNTSVEEKFGKIMTNLIKTIKEKSRGISSLFEKLSTIKNNFSNQSVFIIDILKEESLLKKYLLLIRKIQNLMKDKMKSPSDNKDEITEMNNTLDGFIKKISVLLENLYPTLNRNLIKDEISKIENKINEFQIKLKSIHNNALEENKLKELKLLCQELSLKIGIIQEDISINLKRVLIFSKDIELSQFPFLENECFNIEVLKTIQIKEEYSLVKKFFEEILKVSALFNENQKFFHNLLRKFESFQNILSQIEEILNTSRSDIKYYKIHNTFCNINNYVQSDLNTNSSLYESDKVSIMSLIYKKVKPIMNFLYLHNFHSENPENQEKILKINDYQNLSVEQITLKILSNSDIQINIEQAFINFKANVMKNINDINNFQEMNLFVKNKEKIFYEFKVFFSKLIFPCKNATILFGNSLETSWNKSFEHFETTINLVSDFCDLFYTFETKKDKILQIIEVIGKMDDGGNFLKEFSSFLEKNNEFSILFLIKNAVNLYLASLDPTALENIKELLNSQISYLNKVLLIEKEFMNKIKSKYPKLLILEDADIIKFYWLISNPTKENLDLINTYYYKLTNTLLNIEELAEEDDILEFVVSGIKGRGKDFLKFKNLIQFSFDVPCFLLEIEAEIEYSLKYNLIESLNNFSKMDFNDWILSSNLQVIISDLYLIFTNEVSQLLIPLSKEDDSKNDSSVSEVKRSMKNYSENLHKLSHVSSKDKLGNYMKKIDHTNAIKKVEGDLKEIISKYQVWIEQIEKILKGTQNDLSIYASKLDTKYYIVQNILITLLNQKDILEFLLKNNIYDVNSYEWLKNIRHIWDSQNKEVVIECGGWSIFQHYNYIGNYERLLLTPQTDKIFLFFASCFREKSSTIIKTNISQDGYYEIFEEFANNLWIQIRKVYLSECSLYKKMTTLFDICTMTNNWIFLENLSQLQDQSILYVSKMMQMIQQEIILDEIKNIDCIIMFYLVSNQKEIKKMFCVVGCIRLSEKTKDIDTYLKSSCRIMNIVTPDLNIFSKGIIKLFTIKQSNKEDKPNEVLFQYLECFQNLIRQKNNSFYFDFHVLNLLKNFLINKFTEQSLFSTNSNQIIKPIINGILEFLIDILISLDIKIDDVKTAFSKNVSNSVNYDQIKTDLLNLLEEKMCNKQLNNAISTFDMIISDQNLKKIHYFYNSMLNTNKISLIYGGYGAGKSKTIENMINFYVQTHGKDVKLVYLKEVMFLNNNNHITNIFNLLHENEYDKYDIILIVLENFEDNEVFNMVLSVYNDFFNIKNLKKFRLIIERQQLKNIDFSLISFCNLIYLENINWKKLQKYFLNNIKSNLKSMNILINDEFYPSLLEFTKNVLIHFFTETNEKFLYYKIILLYNYIDLFLKKVLLKKSSQTPKNFLFNIFIQCLIFICYENQKNLSHGDIIKYFQSNVKTYFKTEVTQDFLNELKSDNEVFLDYEQLTFKKLDTFMSISPSNDLMVLGKKEYSALYLLEISYQLKIPFTIFGEEVYGNNIVMRTFMRKHEGQNKIYALLKTSTVSEVHNMKNEEVILYIDDLNIKSGDSSKMIGILDYYCKENRCNSAISKKPNLTNSPIKAFIVGESINYELDFQNSLLYKLNRFQLKNEQDYSKIFKKICGSELTSSKIKSRIFENNEKLFELLQTSLNKFEYLFSKQINLNYLMCLNNFLKIVFCLGEMERTKSFTKFLKQIQSLFYTSFNWFIKGKKYEQQFINFINELENFKEEEIIHLLTSPRNNIYIKEVPLENKSIDNYKTENLYSFFSKLITSNTKFNTYIGLIGNNHFTKCYLDLIGLKSKELTVKTNDHKEFLSELKSKIRNKNDLIILRISNSLSEKTKSIMKVMFLYMFPQENGKLRIPSSQDDEQSNFVDFLENSEIYSKKLIFSFKNYNDYTAFSQEFTNFRKNHLLFEPEYNLKIFQNIINDKFNENEYIKKYDLKAFFRNFDKMLDKKFYETLTSSTLDYSSDLLNINKLFPNYSDFKEFYNDNKFKAVFYFIKFVNFFFEKVSFLSAKNYPLFCNNRTVKTTKSNLKSNPLANIEESKCKDVKEQLDKQLKIDIEGHFMNGKHEEKKRSMLENIRELEDLIGNLSETEYQKVLNENLESKDFKTVNDFLQDFFGIEWENTFFRTIKTLNMKVIFSSKYILLATFKLISILPLSKSHLEELKSKYSTIINNYSKFFSKNTTIKSNFFKLIYNIGQIVYMSVFGEDGSIFLNNYILNIKNQRTQANDILLERIKKNNLETEEKNLSKNLTDTLTNNFSNSILDFTSIYENILGDCFILSILVLFEKNFSFEFMKKITENLIDIFNSTMKFSFDISKNLEKVILFYYKICYPEVDENIHTKKMLKKIIIKIEEKDKNVSLPKNLQNQSIDEINASNSSSTKESFFKENSIFENLINYENQLKYLLLNISDKEKSREFDSDFKNIYEIERLRPFLNESHSFLLASNEENNTLNYLIESRFKKLNVVSYFPKLNSYFNNIEKSRCYLEIKSFLKSIKIYKRLTNELCNKPSFFINDFCNLYFNEKLHTNITPEQLSKKIYESIFFNVDNKFLVNSLITIDFLKNSNELSQQEQSFLIAMLDSNLKTNNNTCIQSLKHLNPDVLNNVKLLLNYYKMTENHQEIIIILDLIIRGYDIYVIKSKIELIKKKSKRLVLLSIYQEEDFFSLLKYLVNKNLIEKFNVEKNKLNDFLNKKTYKAPILVKSEVFVNITNFLCSLASYYETEFIIIRNIEYIENSSFLKYNYIVDNNYKKVINKCYKEGGWLLISCGINLEKIVKIFNFYKEKPHINFRLFIDANLVINDKECKKFLSKYSHIVYIDSVCVDELEAAHDVWVNVLEEKLITETMIDESVTENDQHKNPSQNINDVSTFSKLQFEPDGNHKEGKSYLSDVKELRLLTEELENKF